MISASIKKMISSLWLLPIAPVINDMGKNNNKSNKISLVSVLDPFLHLCDVTTLDKKRNYLLNVVMHLNTKYFYNLLHEDQLNIECLRNINSLAIYICDVKVRNMWTKSICCTYRKVSVRLILIILTLRRCSWLYVAISTQNCHSLWNNIL